MTPTPPRYELLHKTIWYLRPTGRTSGTGKYPIRNALFAKHMTPNPER